jgi:hopanoid biosynthesis associated radical SAM protein HpnJ
VHDVDLGSPPGHRRLGGVHAGDSTGPRKRGARGRLGTVVQTGAEGPGIAFLKTLFLHPPSYDGFDGGAGSRYQARREIRSFWYPTWLAQPAALVPGSRLVDAPPHDLTLDDVRPLARQYELVVLHTSTPSLASDLRVAEALKAENPALRIGLVGPHVAVHPEETLRASPAIDFAARSEFDFTIREVAEGRPLPEVLGLSYRVNGGVHHTPERPVLEDMDALPFVVDVYKRDLTVENYFIGYLLHPYVSLYTGRGCRSRCTFCLWPQTVGGQRYRTRSVDHVVSEIDRARRHFPQVKEYFFDDDTFTDDLPRAEAIARGLGRLGVTWSCNAKANVPAATLRVLRDNGLRLLLVGYESGSQAILNNVRKGIRLDVARRFTAEARALGITIHGTFILGLPGETRQTIEESIRFACELDPDTIQVSIAAPYPGTELHRQAVDNRWLAGDALLDARGVQQSPLSYPHLPHAEIAAAVERFYRRFYFRPRKVATLAGQMLRDSETTRRRLREGREFLAYLARRRGF